MMTTDLRTGFSLVLALAFGLCVQVASAGDPPAARLGGDAAVRLDGDDARLQFVLFTGTDSLHCLETLNETAAAVEQGCAVNYRFVRSSQTVVGSGRATLREAGNGVSITHDVAAHGALNQERAGFILRLRADRFANAEWRADEKVGIVPVKPEHTGIGSGKTKKFTVAFPGGRKWTLTFPKQVAYEVNDMRRQELDDVEVSFFYGSRLNLKAGGGTSATCTLTPSDGKVKPAARGYYGIGAGKSWVKLDMPTGIRPASALDFTRAPTRKAPAGTEGRLMTTTNGTLVLSRTPNEPFRLYGCRAPDQMIFGDKPAQTAYTKQLATYGYNAVRLNRFNARLCVEGAKGLQCDAALSAKFDQFVTGATRDGLYSFCDIVYRHPWRWGGLGIPSPGGEQPSTDLSAALCLCDDRAFAAWQRLVDAVYVRKNKVGRKSYPEDAAVPLVSVMTEGSSFGEWSSLQKLPFMRERYAAWLAAKRKEKPDFIKAENCCEPAAFGTLGIRDTKAGSIRMFLAETDIAGIAKMRDHLQKLKTKALVGAALGQPYYSDVAQLRATAGDFSCGVFTIDAPRQLGEKYSTPYRIRNVNPLLASSPISSAVTMHERPDRVMCLTSWKVPAPSSWRALSGLLVGGWAGKHGWDALLAEDDPTDDPFAAAIERAVYALYARGDLTTDAPADSFVIEKGALTVKTPKTVGGFSPVSKGRIVAVPLVAELKGARAAVWVSSLTDQPVATSKRLLLTHLTEMQREGTLFADSRCDLLMRRGAGPYVVRDGTADIQLAVEKPSTFKVYALTADGMRQTRIATDLKDGMLAFTAAVRGAKNAQYVYEIVRD